MTYLRIDFTEGRKGYRKPPRSPLLKEQKWLSVSSSTNRMLSPVRAISYNKWMEYPPFLLELILSRIEKKRISEGKQPEPEPQWERKGIVYLVFWESRESRASYSKAGLKKDLWLS
jgi:hypothetical protein